MRTAMTSGKFRGKRKSYSQEERESLKRERMDLIEGHLDRAVEDFLNLIDEGAGDEALKKYIVFSKSLYQYSWRNLILCWMQLAEREMDPPSIVMGASRWRKHKRFPMKGQKGLLILRPETRSRPAGKDEEHAAVTVVNKKTGKPERRISWTSFVPAFVFDVQQTDGEPLPEAGVEAQGDDPKGLCRLVADYCAANGVEYGVDATLKGQPCRGYTNGKRISIAPDLTEAGVAAVSAHELAHVLLHFDGDDSTRAVREVEAEMAAYLLCRMHGIEHDGAAKYILLWSGMERDKARSVLAGSLERVRGVVSKVLGTVDWKDD